MKRNKPIADGIRDFIKELMEQKKALVVDSTEQKRINFEYSVEYNAMRILLIVEYCGVNGKIDSKIKFTFYDFLIRYPICLKLIFEKMGISEEFSDAELTSIDKQMVKHISSAWDPEYYNYLSFLDARDLITINYKEKFEIRLTPLGRSIVKEFRSSGINKIIHRYKIIKKTFSKKKDNVIEEIIKNNFSFAVL